MLLKTMTLERVILQLSLSGAKNKPSQAGEETDGENGRSVGNGEQEKQFSRGNRAEGHVTRKGSTERGSGRMLKTYSAHFTALPLQLPL